jgi:hypothetical protein
MALNKLHIYMCSSLMDAWVMEFTLKEIIKHFHRIHDTDYESGITAIWIINFS